MSLDRQESGRHGESNGSTNSAIPALSPLPGSPNMAQDSLPERESAFLTGIKNKVSEPVTAAFLAGGVAGAVSRTIVSPLERLKILLQIQTVVQFGSYNFYKKASHTKSHCNSAYIAQKGTNASNMRTRLSIQSASFAALGERHKAEKLPGMFKTMVLIYKNEGGIVALYRGIVPTVAGVAPYVGLNFMTYESIRKYLTPENDKNPSPLRKLLAGALSGAVAQTCTYPFDVLRRRFQINTMSGMGYQYKSIGDAVRVIVAEEGLRGLFKGIVPNLLKVAPSMASSWLSFEITRDFLLELGDK
ncbi:conserved hypothetical protein [Aspergillus terreus NIH2624]|uniref:Mitochondrial thiamine pyrophosphate carrier 1 n=1 Tax=Aspergillus terreus (strain NIH 2624 / FGSC A1156) TaxID=341663 RepID=Q0CHI6_ASPTN|nr:uncharacterized protein ATEG_06848 [Aspergillus terreus NIH2624]EAU32232.1 conserved hypothetical protein [Aspergillus terreus NIH2624]